MKKICVILVTAILCVTLVSTAKGKTVYVDSENGLRVRSEPSTESEIVDVLHHNEEVKVLGETEEWLKTTDGYIHGDYVSETEAETNMTYIGEWHLTAYTATGNPCANGNYPTAGYTVACNNLDFGTKVYIEGIGYRTVEDRGPSGMGDWLDIYHDSYEECVNFGSQYRAVYLVED